MNETLSPTDPRTIFAKAVRVGGSVIANVRPDQLNDPTPCTEFDTNRLIGHLVAVLDRAAAVGRGEDSMAVHDIAPDPADGDWSAAWLTAAHGVQQGWTDAARLDATVVFPWATTTGGETLAMYANEIVVHIWDLAQATGQQQPAWDDDVVAASFAVMQGMLPGNDREAQFDAAREHMPEEFRDFGPPFRNVVPTPVDAAMIDKLIAWNGRQPC